MSEAGQDNSGNTGLSGSPRPRRRLLLWLVSGLVLVLVAGGLVMFGLTRDEVRPGTRVAGVSVGGLDEKELRAVVSGALRQKVEKPVTLTVGKLGTRTINPPDAGIQLDQDATVKKLMDAGPGDLFAPVRAAFG